MESRYTSITSQAPGVEINKQIFVVVYRSIFTGFTISISPFQVFYILFILSFLYIFSFSQVFIFSGFTFLLFYEVFYCLNSQIFTYIFVYSHVFCIFPIFRFYYIFYILTFSIFSLLLCFSYVLYFEFHLPVPIDFLPRNCLMYQFILRS